MHLVAQVVDIPSKVRLDVSRVNSLIWSVVVAPALRSVVASVVAHFRGPESLSGLNLLPNYWCDLGPVRAADDHSEPNIKDDACDTKTEPEALDAHFSIEGKE